MEVTCSDCSLKGIRRDQNVQKHSCMKVLQEKVKSLEERNAKLELEKSSCANQGMKNTFNPPPSFPIFGQPSF